MNDSSLQPQSLEPAIESLLARLRRRIRAYVWIEGIAASLVLVGLSFWGSLGVDWVFEPPALMRMALLWAFCAAMAYVMFRLIFRRAFTRLASSNLAMVLERRFPRFNESLLTAVELTVAPRHAEPFNPQMLAMARQHAVDATGNLELSKVFNTRPLYRRAGAAVLLLASIVGFGVMASDAMGIWVRRSLMLSDELWPRKTHLSVEGFGAEGHVKVARGADLDLVVLADAAPQREVPEIVEIRSNAPDGSTARENMSREGIAARTEGAYQRYSYTFKGVFAPRAFLLLGGDDRLGPLKIEVVDSPTISQMVLHCQYPAYTRRAPRDVSVTGVMQVPRGTQATLRAQTNKPIVQVQVDDLSDEKAPISRKLLLAQEYAQSRFELDMPPILADKTMLFTLLDADGIHTRDPIRLSITATPDEAPVVNVSLRGVGSAVTPAARLPAAGEIVDDYGIARAWFDYHVGDEQPRQREFIASIAGQDKLPVDELLDLEPLKLQPKQKFYVAIQAADTDALAATPNIGASQHYLLDVVTPEQLRAMLEARELVLRRRFETIMQEMTANRDRLARIEFESPGAPSAKEPAPVVEDDGKLQEPGDEPGDAASPAKVSDPEEQLASRRLQRERVQQNGERSAHETLEVAAAFDDIREELINNRVDTEEIKTRLKDGIADPLRRISAEMFPEFEARLKKLEQDFGDPVSALVDQKAAVAQADLILIEMKQVLDKMLELETFNEVLDLLRGIISSQEKINEQTKDKQKKKLRNLLE